MVETQQLFEVWTQLEGQRLIDLRLARSAAVQLIKLNRSIWTREEKREAESDKKEIAAKIKELEKEKKELEKLVSDLTTPVNLAKAVLKKEEDEFPTGDRWVRAELEQIYLR